MIRRTLLAAALAGLVLSAGGTASPSADRPANGRIVFATFGRLIQANPDGTGIWPLSAAAPRYEPGDWSPDGTRLAVSSEGDIHLVDPRGLPLARLTFSPGFNSDPSFSPDGSRIAFESSRNGEDRIWVMNADGTSQRPLSPTVVGPSFDPAWSPDGEEIAFTAFHGGAWEIEVMSIAGTHLRRLTERDGIDRDPTWSPDGSRIAFASDEDGGLDIYTMATDGSGVRQLTTTSAVDRLPEWSPDGSRIAFVSERSGEHAPFVMDSSGANQSQLAFFTDWGIGLTWQPLPREPLAATIWGPLCTIWGTSADDLLVGTPARDVICGLDGADRLLGGEGRDTIVGGDGNDSIVAGPGGDLVVGGTGDDLVDSRDREPDSVEAGSDRDTVLVDRELDHTLGGERVFDPDPSSLTRGRPVRASLALPAGPPELAVDGHLRLFWGALYAPAWIEVDLGRSTAVGGIQLVVAQTPPGDTLHVVLGKGGEGRWRHLTSFAGTTRDGEVLRYVPRTPWRDLRAIRISTRRSPSWVAWKEIRAELPPTRP